MQQSYDLAAGKSLDRVDLGFLAHGLQVENCTNQWYYVPSARRFIPPYWLGITIPLPGEQSASLMCQSPPVSTQAAPIAGETVHATWLSDSLAAGAGVSAVYEQAPVFYGQHVTARALLNVGIVGYYASGVGPAIGVVHASLLVPAGAVAYIEMLRAVVHRDGTPSVFGIASATIRWTPVGLSTPTVVCLAQIQNSETALYVVHEDQCVPFGFLNPGDLLELLTSDNGTGGSCMFDLVIKYMLFQAP